MRVSPDGLNQILRPIFDPKEVEKALKEGRMVTKGLNAGPGAATGKVVYNAEDAESWAGRGEKVILVRIETSPEDIRGMNAAQGILTSRGGMTSHAALVARQMGKVCVAGCGDLDINYRTKTIKIKGQDDQRRRLHLHQRQHRRGLRRRSEDHTVGGPEGPHRQDPQGRRFTDISGFRLPHVMGRLGEAARRADECRPAGPGADSHRLRRPGDRPLPDRAHVLRREADRRGAGDDTGRRP